MWIVAGLLLGIGITGFAGSGLLYIFLSTKIKKLNNTEKVSFYEIGCSKVIGPKAFNYTDGLTWMGLGFLCSWESKYLLVLLLVINLEDLLSFLCVFLQRTKKTFKAIHDEQMRKLKRCWLREKEKCRLVFY